MISFDWVFAAINNCKQGSSNPTCTTTLPQVTAGDVQLKRLLSVVFGVIAAIAVITIMIAAINFTTAGSDTEKIARSKRAIIYALVGLVIALLAEVIVLTVIGKF